MGAVSGLQCDARERSLGVAIIREGLRKRALAETTALKPIDDPALSSDEDAGAYVVH